MLLLLAGCVSRGVVVAGQAPSGVVALRVLPCVDRTQTTGRDLGAEATAAFRAALAASPDFRLDPAAEDALSCDVVSFLPGNAAKRLVFPGWGDAAAQVAAMISDRQSGATRLIVVGNATLTLGGAWQPAGLSRRQDRRLLSLDGRRRAVRRRARSLHVFVTSVKI